MCRQDYDRMVEFWAAKSQKPTASLQNPGLTGSDAGIWARFGSGEYISLKKSLKTLPLTACTEAVMICSRPEVCIQEKDEEWKLQKTNGRHASSVHRLSGDIRHQQQVHLRQKDRDSEQQQDYVKEDN